MCQQEIFPDFERLTFLFILLQHKMSEFHKQTEQCYHTVKIASDTQEQVEQIGLSMLCHFYSTSNIGFIEFNATVAKSITQYKNSINKILILRGGI